METLRKSAITMAILGLALSFPFRSFSQDYTALQTAFKNSYTWENKAEYSRAVEEIKKVYDENSYELNIRLGWLTYESGLFTESLSYYQKAMALMPYAIEPKFGYVCPAAALGNWDKVMTQYIDILKIDPNNTLANYRLGSIYYGKEDYNAAFKYFEKVANLYPFDYDNMLMFAWANYKLGKLREAKVLFGKVLLMKPEDSSALEGISLIK